MTLLKDRIDAMTDVVTHSDAVRLNAEICRGCFQRNGQPTQHLRRARHLAVIVLNGRDQGETYNKYQLRALYNADPDRPAERHGDIGHTQVWVALTILKNWFSDSAEGDFFVPKKLAKADRRPIPDPSRAGHMIMDTHHWVFTKDPNDADRQLMIDKKSMLTWMRTLKGRLRLWKTYGNVTQQVAAGTMIAAIEIFEKMV